MSPVTDQGFVPVRVTATQAAAPQAPVVVIFGDIPITRAELSDHLLRRLRQDQLQQYINLRIIDEDGGIANTTLYFFVNTKKVYSFAFGGGDTPLDAVGAFNDCQPALNCKDHSATVFYGAKRLTTTEIASSTTGCNTPHQDLLAPSGEEVASGNPLDVAGEDLTEVGKYKINPLLMGMLLTVSLGVIVANAVIDALSEYLDPRVRRG